MSRVLVTGANGFVGSRLCKELMLQNRDICASVRRSGPQSANSEFKYFETGDIGARTDWTAALSHVTQVIHLASRVHVMLDTVADPLSEYRKVNVQGTLALARQAAQAGVSRFIFLSSVKVNGEVTVPGRPYLADSPAAPVDPYGISKMEAEEGLRQLAATTNMDVVIIRPPLVYGPGVKANFLKMMQVLDRGIPLPFGSIHNKRSLVSLDNLIDLLIACIDHPAAANKTLLVSDDCDLSTPELLSRMANALGRRARLLPIPAVLLKLGASVVGKTDVALRLTESLQVDIRDTRSLLGWAPPVSVDDALKATARHYLGLHE